MTHSPAIELTAAAAQQLRALRGDDATRAYLRLYVAGRTCCSYRYGLAFASDASMDDTVTECDGLRIAIDPDSQPFCDGVRIDFVSSNTGEGFHVLGPGASNSCACGRRPDYG
jgi:iron-sulfur cluster assembly protein